MSLSPRVQFGHGQPGGSVSYHQVLSSHFVSDTQVGLSGSSRGGWGVAVDPSSLTAQPGMTYTINVTVSAETSASPEQVLAAARDFSEHRAQIWPNVEAKRLEVHERGDTWAVVTEGTMVVGVFWERCRYDWSEPTQLTAP